MSNISSSNIIKKKIEYDKPNTITRNKSITEIFYELQEIAIENSEYLIPIVVIGSLVTFVTYQIYSAINDKQPLENLTTHVYLIMIPVILIFSYLLYIIFDNKSKYMFFLLSGCLLIGFFIIFGVIKLSNIKFNLSIANLFYYMLISAILLFGLSVFYNVFANQLRTTDTWGSFWIELIFYIPCMIDMFIKYMTKDYANTSTRIIILFLIEILLIICYFWLYPIFKNSIYDNGTIVLKNPVFLDNVVSNLIQPINAAGTNRIPPIQAYNYIDYIIYPDPSSFLYRTNYSISLWVYVNPMPMTRLGYSEETNLFLYGRGWNSSLIEGTNNKNSGRINNSLNPSPSPSSNPKKTIEVPKVDYHPRLSMTQVKDNYLFNFYYSKDKRTHQLEIPLQKWNNIVFNYIENGVDVFINGELTLSYNFSNNDMPKYNEEDDIIVGDENGITNIHANAIYGSMCNIVYYNNPLTKRQIILNYNMLVLQNPPIL